MPTALAAESRNPDPFVEHVYQRFEEARDLLLQKHKDYGPKNIANAPGGPLVGLAVRLHDKLARLAHLTRTGAEMPKNESIRDTFLDIANYGIIGLLVLDGDWPGLENPDMLKRPQFTRLVEPLAYCGRGICSNQDGHEGKCST